MNRIFNKIAKRTNYISNKVIEIHKKYKVLDKYKVRNNTKIIRRNIK